MEKPTNKSTHKPRGFMALLARAEVRTGLGLAELVLAYVFASWAIDTGSLIDYTITLLLVIIGIHDVIMGVKTWRRGK